MKSFQVILGVDWADEKHAVCLMDREKGLQEAYFVENTPGALTDWVASLRKRFPDTPIAVCLEQKRGALIYALMKYEFLVLLPVNPKQLARFREVVGVSGAKDDPNDAQLLAELCAKHGEHMRIWNPGDEQTRLLMLLVEARRHLVDERTALKNRLKSCLKEYFPQALELCPQLHSPLACALFARWPSLPALQAASNEEIIQVFRDCHCNNSLQRARRLQIIREGIPLTKDVAIVTSHQMLVRCLVRQILDLNEAIAEFSSQIEMVFHTHTDYAIFHSFPGAGPAMGPRLLSAFGSDRDRYAGAVDLQALSGIAPVTRQSGKSRVVRRRWACNKFLRQTFHEYAAQSVKYSSWARAYYTMMKARTGGHHAALRALAFKWMRILFRCWQNHDVYDEARYLESLRRHQAPLLRYLMAETADE
jgi:transposase